MNERKVLEVTYTSLDGNYKNPSLRYIRGFQDADSSTPSAGTLDDPRNSGIPLLPETRDPKIFSFAYRGDVFFLLCSVVTPIVGQASTEGRWSLIMAPTPPLGAWALMARDILLQDNNNNSVLDNPFGLAQIGNTLYIVEYDTQRIYILGANELNGLPDGATHELDKPSVDLSVLLDESDAKGQAIIAMTPATGDPIIAILFTVSHVQSTSPVVVVQDPGILVRLTLTSAGLVNGTKVFVGRNPQEIVPVTGSNGTSLLIPAIGGMQKAGASNGTNSNISCVPAYGAWTLDSTAPVLLTGDDSQDGCDIKDVAASYRANNGAGVVYILALINNADFVSTKWQLYKTTVDYLLSLTEATISEVLGNAFVSIDNGTESPGWFWELLYETADDPAKDRLWFFRGSAILACPALAYPAFPVNPTPPDASYRYFNTGEKDGDIGGANVDWADLTIETVRQIAAGHSLKRGVRASVPAGAKGSEEGEG
jgi:hypothetical protein